MPVSKPRSLRPDSKNPISVSIAASFSEIGRRNARVVSAERILRAQAVSWVAASGWQTRILRRLGVSPGPVGFSGPLMPRFVTPAVPASSEYRSSTCLLYTSDAADERSSVDLGG